MIEYEFGVMSSKYKLQSKSLRTAKLSMVLFLKTSAPIVIYKPKSSAFKPKEFMSEEVSKKPPKDLKEVFDSIEECIDGHLSEGSKDE